MRAADLVRAPARELAERLRAGHAIDPRALDDTAYRGTSLGLPRAIVALTWLTFRKTFHRDPRTGALRGWNVRLEQRGLEGPSVPMKRRGRTWAFGHYAVRAGDPASPLALPDGALLLDYGVAGSPLDAARLVRDPLVALRPGDPTLLLGWSYVEAGPLRLRTPSYFVLEREGPLDEVEPAPAAR